MGRKPTPTKLRILRGNPGRRPLPEHEPNPGPFTHAPPTSLTPAGKTEWNRLVPLLDRLGVLAETDRDAMITYCETFAIWQDAINHIKRDGAVEKIKGIPTVSPYMRIAQNTLHQLRALLVEFGLTPSSRSRVAAHPAKSTNDEWVGLL
jgi:P27 family predicted phage terminase small subunit